MDKLKEGDVVWDNWVVESLIGEGSYGIVYKISRTEFKKKYYAALKIVKVPGNSSEIKQAYNDGMNDDEVKNYFESITESLIDEVEVMYKFKGVTNIVSFEEHRVELEEDGISYKIMIKMELLTALDEHLANNSFTNHDVIKLGIDICKALEHCSKIKVIHRDIKPENIFVSEFGDYKLGDFGIAKTMDRTTSGMSKKGTYVYMSPEVHFGKNCTASVDIYSLGIVMYKLLNNNRTPFLPDPPAAITLPTKEEAQERRLSGEKMVKPFYAKDELGDIILKACEFNAKNRYKTAIELREDLTKILSNIKEEVVLSNLEKSSSRTTKTSETEKTVSMFSTKTDKTALNSAEVLASEEVASPLYINNEPTQVEAQQYLNNTNINSKKMNKRLIAVIFTTVILLVISSMFLFRNQAEDITLEFEARTLTLPPNESTNLPIKTNVDEKSKLTWLSDNDRVATVDRNGKIKTKETGEVEITVMTEDGKVKDKIKIRVVEKIIEIESITLDKYNLTMTEGDSIVLNAVVLPEEASNKEVIFESGNTAIVQVDTNGTITAKKAGKTQIKVKGVADDKEAICEVTVIAPTKPTTPNKSNSSTKPTTKTVQYRYRDKQTTTSTTSKTMSGWTYEKETSAWSDYGSWSAWSKTKATASESRQVEQRNVLDTYDEWTYKAFRCQSIATGAWAWVSPTGSCPSGSRNGWWDTITVKTKMVWRFKEDGYDLYSIKSTDICHTNDASNCWYYDKQNRIKDKTVNYIEYRYRDRKKVTTYYFWKWGDWSKWQTSEIKATSTRQVEKREV